MEWGGGTLDPDSFSQGRGLKMVNLCRTEAGPPHEKIFCSESDGSSGKIVPNFSIKTYAVGTH